MIRFSTTHVKLAVQPKGQQLNKAMFDQLASATGTASSTSIVAGVLYNGRVSPSTWSTPFAPMLTSLPRGAVRSPGDRQRKQPKRGHHLHLHPSAVVST